MIETARYRMGDLVIATFEGARYQMRRYQVTSLSEVPLYTVWIQQAQNGDIL
jgi:hypothetical protein